MQSNTAFPPFFWYCLNLSLLLVAVVAVLALAGWQACCSLSRVVWFWHWSSCLLLWAEFSHSLVPSRDCNFCWKIVSSCKWSSFLLMLEQSCLVLLSLLVGRTAFCAPRNVRPHPDRQALWLRYVMLLESLYCGSPLVYRRPLTFICWPLDPSIKYISIICRYT